MALPSQSWLTAALYVAPPAMFFADETVELMVRVVVCLSDCRRL